MFLFKITKNILQAKLNGFQISKAISTSPQVYLKEIHEQQKGNELVIKGVTVPSPREPYMLEKSVKDACPVCASGLDIKHTDVLILSQFLRSDACMLPRRVTGLCRPQQKRISDMVSMARKAGLIPRSVNKGYREKNYNSYFFESTIGQKKKKKKENENRFGLKHGHGLIREDYRDELKRGR